ncbi:MAG: isocitrate lyase/PEP mutase family protein [Myxococcota bacterium]
MKLFPEANSQTDRLRFLLAQDQILEIPGCFDALSARIIERAGFNASFLGGFSVAASRLGLPDVGLLSYGEMIDQARQVCAATSLPVIGDADTGYGNPINAQRTLLGCAQAGLSCLMIEDQSWPKRCGHTEGKEVVAREEAVRRVKACVRAREEFGADILIMARTDANATNGMDEALWRMAAFADAGADLTFLEAPIDTKEMERYCESVPGWKVANLVEDGRTPWLSPSQLSEMGFSVALYPVSLLLHSIGAMQSAAEAIRHSDKERTARADFDEARSLVGWSDYESRLKGFEGSSGIKDTEGPED